jgi:hypothetical protein
MLIHVSLHAVRLCGWQRKLAAELEESQRGPRPRRRRSRSPDIRQCQGVVLADWIATRGDGQTLGAGTNVFMLGSDTKIASVVGLWN